ncbi:MAG: universal stress protein, partial [Actinomycetota bacterium]
SHYAPCDVVITRTSEDPTRAVDPYRKILIGTDGSETAFDAVKRGFRLATSLGAEVTLVFVGPEDPGQYILQETARQLGDAAKISTVIMEGDPADTICEVARREGVDLIVVGNKGMSGARRVLLGSVPNKVSHTADSDVLIARTVEKSLLDLKPGDGGVVTIEGQKVAAYLDPSGQVFAVSARCTHMGCTVAWNHADQTWDCPCHGSRFDRQGEVVNGPANRPLPKVDV